MIYHADKVYSEVRAGTGWVYHQPCRGTGGLDNPQSSHAVESASPVRQLMPGRSKFDQTSSEDSVQQSGATKY